MGRARPGRVVRRTLPLSPAALTMRDARADPVFRGKDPRAPWTCEPHVRERHAGERDREARAGNTHVRCDASGASRAGDL